MRMAIALCIASATLVTLPEVSKAQPIYVGTPLLIQGNRSPTPFAQYPRIERALQSYIDPFAAWERNRTEHGPYSEQPILDAAPVIGKSVLLVLVFLGSPTLIPVGLTIPIAIRASRVILWGSPVYGPPRDTAIWIAAPSVLRLRNHIRDRRGANQPVMCFRR